MEKKKENFQKITIGESYNLGQSIIDLSRSCPTMKGKIMFTLSWNETKIDSSVKKSEKRRKDIIDSFIKLDEKKEPIYTTLTEDQIKNGERPKFIFLTEDGEEKCTKAVNELMSEEIEIPLRKIYMNEFENLDISPSRNQHIGVFMKYLLSEERKDQMISI